MLDGLKLAVVGIAMNVRPIGGNMPNPQTTTPRQSVIDWCVLRTLAWPVPHTALFEMARFAPEEIEKCFPHSIAKIREIFREMMP